MKIDIEAMALEADPGYQEGLASASIFGKAAITEFARLIVERCASVCDKRYMGDNNREDMEARKCAAAIRSLLED